MKIRTGFVTNSSSSSFICVLAEVVDKEKFEASGLGKSHTGSEFNNYKTIFYSLGADWANVYIDEKLSDDKEYFYWEEYGGAGDDDHNFSVLNGRGDYSHMDYDVDLTNFPEDEQAMFCCATKENGLRLIDHGFGAGRNG